jgi:hypothetical protein
MASIISFEGQGYTDIPTLSHQLFTTLIANGFTLIYPAILTGTDPTVTLEAGQLVDPLHSPTAPLVAQPYRIRFAISENALQLNIGTATQLPNDGTLSHTAPDVSGNMISSGLVGIDMTPSHPDLHFVDRSLYTTALVKNATPMSYKISISDHGFAIGVWEPANDVSIDVMSWVVVQRSVSNVNGHVTGIDLPTNKAPLFCVFNIYRINPIDATLSVTTLGKRKFVVRELDIVRPTLSVDASVESDDVRQSIPTHTIVSILESGSYNVSMLGGLNTQRYQYPQDELDLIAYTSADVISAGLLASFIAYGEVTPRNYRALPATGANNTSVRILMYDSHQ